MVRVAEYRPSKGRAQRCRGYQGLASSKKDDRLGLEACLKSLRAGDTLIVWKLERLDRGLTHLVNLIDELQKRGIGLKVLTGQGANIDTPTATGKLVFGIFATRFTTFSQT